MARASVNVVTPPPIVQPTKYTLTLDLDEQEAAALFHLVGYRIVGDATHPLRRATDAIWQALDKHDTVLDKHGDRQALRGLVSGNITVAKG